VRVTATLGTVLEMLGGLAPWDLALPGDSVGLQVGHRGQPVDRVVVALDPDAGAVARAVEVGAQLLVTHHPLLYAPPRRIDIAEPGGALLAEVVRRGLGVVAAHTNLDVAARGLAQHVADGLGLEGIEPLAVTETPAMTKLVTYIPASHLTAVREALDAAGAGVAGPYRGCSFALAGKGYFTPLPGARPFVGGEEGDQGVEEVRLETWGPAWAAPRLEQVIRLHHPYQEPVVDRYPLLAPQAGVGLGRVGKRKVASSRLVDEVKAFFGTRALRTVGTPPPAIETIAVVPGSGGDLVRPAAAAGVQAFITGEVRYHQGLEAVSRGLWVLELGHDVSEMPAVDLLAGFLRTEAGARATPLEVVAHRAATPYQLC
jgi:dinuclear metal center YbgI/SA1388 family protein